MEVVGLRKNKKWLCQDLYPLPYGCTVEKKGEKKEKKTISGLMHLDLLKHLIIEIKEFQRDHGHNVGDCQAFQSFLHFLVEFILPDMTVHTH